MNELSEQPTRSMKIFGRKPRTFNDMLDDPALPYQIGRLVGATEIAGHLLTNQENPDIKQIGQRLTYVVDWFFQPEGPR